MGNRQFDAAMIKWMNENPAPCMRCPGRHATCHSGCGKFEDWTGKKEEAKSAMWKKSDPDVTMYEKESDLRRRARKAAGVYGKRAT